MKLSFIKNRKLVACALILAAAAAVIASERSVHGTPIELVAIPRSPVEGSHSEGKPETEFVSGEEGDPFERDREFWEQRAYPLNTIPSDIHRAAIQAEVAQGAARASTALINNWTNLGPAPVKNITYGGVSNQDASGRALAIAVQSANSNIVLVGAAQGGIWKSVDGAASFTSVGEPDLPSPAIKVYRFAHSNPALL